jgi:hypothetical protein
MYIKVLTYTQTNKNLVKKTSRHSVMFGVMCGIFAKKPQLSYI